MEYRKLGNSGVEVSALALGGMMFGWYGNAQRQECIRMIHMALDGGVTIIDTADRYSRGESEEIIGEGIRDRRDDVFLVTKGSLPMEAGPNTSGGSRRWIRRAVENSLRRLGVDHIDGYLLHRPDFATAFDETISTLDDLVREGKIHYWGTSTFPTWHIVEGHRVADRLGCRPPSVEQLPYSILFRDVEFDHLEVCRRYAMGAMVWSPLGSGWLTGKYRRDEVPAPGSRADRTDVFAPAINSRFDRSDPAVMAKFDIVDALAIIAAEEGVSLTHLALGFALEHPAVTTAIVGCRTPEQLEDVLAGADTRLSTDALDAIDTVVAPGSHIPSADRRWFGGWTSVEHRRRA